MLFLIIFLKRLEILDSLAIRLVVLTGKCRYPLHPKHLIRSGPLWFSKYLKKTDTVLDLGSDNGMHTLKSARKVKNITGIEHQITSLRVARELACYQNIRNVQFLEGDLEKKLNFPSNKFNKVLFLDVLEHLNRRNQIMKECYRVLKINGKLFISIPNSETRWKRLLRKNGINSFADPDHKIEYTRDEAISVCTNVGFKVVSIDPITLDTPLSPIFGVVGGISLALYKKLMEWKKNKILENPEETVGFRIVAQKV